MSEKGHKPSERHVDPEEPRAMARHDRVTKTDMLGQRVNVASAPLQSGTVMHTRSAGDVRADVDCLGGETCREEGGRLRRLNERVDKDLKAARKLCGGIKQAARLCVHDSACRSHIRLGLAQTILKDRLLGAAQR